jgi:hypothetical protein
MENIGRRFQGLSEGYLVFVAVLAVHRDSLVVQLSFLEKLAAFRGDLEVPLASIDTIVVEDQPWGALRGFRAPGTGLPGVIAYGTRLVTGGAPDFAALHGRRPAVRIELRAGAPFGRLLVTVDDPAGAVAAVPRGAPVTPS